jgi:hypothetical protein
VAGGVCHAEAVDRRRNTAIDRRLPEDLPDLLLGHAVLDRSAHMQLEFVRPVQGGDHGRVEEAACAPVVLGAEHFTASLTAREAFQEMGL